MTEIDNVEDPSRIDKCQLWAGEIAAAEKELEKFFKRANSVTKRYLDERDAVNAGVKWFNIFYANTTILQSAIYAQLPKPAVSRKYVDYNDEVGRVAALIIERAITQDLDDPTDTFDSCMRNAVQDRLVPGLAQAWLRLETDTEEISIPPQPGMDVDGPDDLKENGAPPQRIVDQRVCVDYIFWQDFLWSPCRVWEERRWVGRKAYLTREELIERFGEEKGRACPLNYSGAPRTEVDSTSTPKEDVLKKAVVYEIWDRTTRKVVWYTKGMTQLLDERDDPLGLKGFDPCPMPMLANITTSNTTPRPDYFMIQDQYTELDTVNNRISMLVQACKVVGVYDKGSPAIARLLKEGFDNDLIPADNWAMFAEKGGVKGQIDWLPLEVVVQALTQLNAARDVIKGQIYELTGIADIVRGASKASETLGAQQIKAQFASVRIKKLQDEVARFASAIMRLKAEIMIKHFDPQLIIKKSNIMATGNDEWVGPAMALLQNDSDFEWRIQVNADTMSQADYAMEKQDRIDFMTAFSGFMKELPPLLGSVPQAAPVLVGLVKWSVAGFRGARDIEGMLDKALDGLLQQQKQPQGPQQPSPEQLKLQAEQAAAQQEFEQEKAKFQAEQAAAAQEFEREKLKFQAEQTAEQQKFERDKIKFQAEQAAEQQKFASEQQLAAVKARYEEQTRQQQLEFTSEMNALKLESARELLEVKLDGAERQNQLQQQAAEATSKAAEVAKAQELKVVKSEAAPDSILPVVKALEEGLGGILKELTNKPNRKAVKNSDGSWELK